MKATLSFDEDAMMIGTLFDLTFTLHPHYAQTI
jgi:hypothetical protein